MIIEIALGIVLAVIVLSLLPLIVAAGTMALIVGIVLLLGGLLLYWVLHFTEAFFVILAIVSVFLGGSALANFLAKRTLLTAEEAGGLMVIAAVLGFVAFSLFEQYQKFGDISTEAQNLLPGLALLAVLSMFLWRRVRKRKHGRSVEA